MPTKEVYTNGVPRTTHYIYQENFFGLVPRPEFRVTGQPNRTLSTFWNSDILPTTLEIRRIYIGKYKPEDDVNLIYVWNWLKIEENKKMLQQGASRSDSEALKRWPTEVLLNYQTALFFTMHDDFKRNPKVSLFEPFVAYRPGTSDWENDIRRTTFEYVTKLKERPAEPGTCTYSDPAAVILSSRPEINEPILERYDYIDSITWVILTKYHLELLKRERNTFANK